MLGDQIVAGAEILHLTAQRSESRLGLQVLRAPTLTSAHWQGRWGEVVTRVICSQLEQEEHLNFTCTYELDIVAVVKLIVVTCI